MNESLFRPNVFSKPAAGFKVCPASEKVLLAGAMTRLYPHVRVRTIERVGEIGCNSMNWRVRSNKGTFILKRTDQSRLSMLELQARFNLLLTERGFPVVRFETGANKRLVAVDGRHAYSLTQFVAGSRFSGSWSEWTDLMAWTKKLALAARETGVPAPFRKIPPRDFFENGEKGWIRRANQRPFSLSTRQIGYLLVRHAEIEAECRVGKSTAGIFHVDLHPLNLLFARGKLRCIVDFDSYRRTGLEFAAGFSAFKCLREVVVRAGGSRALARTMKRAAPILSRTFPGIPPARLLTYGQADVMKRAVFVLRDYLESGNRQWLAMFPIQLAGLREIDRMREALG